MTVRFESDAPAEATLAADPPRSNATSGGRHRAEWELESTGEPVELAATVPTVADGKAAALHASYRTAGDPADRPVPGKWQLVPWTPPTAPASAATSPIPFSLAGGDARRGEAVFNGAEAKCSACHQVGGKGGQTGPASMSWPTGIRPRSTAISPSPAP